MVARLSKYGYLSEEIPLTDGPFEWVAITGRRRGRYFLLKPDLHVTLEAVSNDDTSSVDATGKIGPIPPPSDAGVISAEDKPASDTGTVAIASDPPNAEIFVDGKFAGRTPATIRLAAGKRRIELRGPNTQSWERTLEVLEDSELSLHAALSQQP